MKKLIFLLLISPSIFAQENVGKTLVDEITSIYDGYTFRATINEWPEIIHSYS